MFRITLFIINTVVLVYYYQMAPFFIPVIQEDEKEARKFKCAMWVVIGILTVTICQENVLLPVW